MRVLVGAVSVTEGGGLVVLKNIVENISHLSTDVTWYLSAPAETLSKISPSSNIVMLPYGQTKKSIIHNFFWHEFTLPRLVKKLNIDVFYSQTNYLPKRKLTCATLLLVQNAGFFSKKFQLLHFQWKKKLLSRINWLLKVKLVYRAIHLATLVTVQTRTLADKIIDEIKIPADKIIVIPHGPGLVNVRTRPRAYLKESVYQIGYITKFGVQKNFDTVFKAVRILKNKGMPIKLILTLNENTPDFKYIYKKIVANEIEENVVNYGEVSNKEEIQKLYNKIGIFVFPSLCESFGFPLLEAMASGLPIIAADTDSNKEIMGEFGELCAPEDEEQLCKKIIKLIDDEEYYLQASINSIAQAKKFSWATCAQQTFDIIVSLMKDHSHNEKGNSK